MTEKGDHQQLLADLKILAETLLERVEPELRRAAHGVDGTGEARVPWASCDWCPVCALAALLRGEHHDLLAVAAEHGATVVTVLREALAGVPVDPVVPDFTAPPPSGAGHDAPAATYVAIPVTITE